MIRGHARIRLSPHWPAESHSAKVREEYRTYVKEFEPHLTLDEYLPEYWESFGNT